MSVGASHDNLQRFNTTKIQTSRKAGGPPFGAPPPIFLGLGPPTMTHEIQKWYGQNSIGQSWSLPQGCTIFFNDPLKTHKRLCVQITEHKLIHTQQTDPPSQGRSRQLRQGRASQWATPPSNLQKTGRKTRRPLSAPRQCSRVERGVWSMSLGWRASTLHLPAVSRVTSTRRHLPRKSSTYFLSFSSRL